MRFLAVVWLTLSPEIQRRGVEQEMFRLRAVTKSIEWELDV